MLPNNVPTIQDVTDATQFRSILGGLQYLSITRPDAAFTVNKLSQFMHRPTSGQWSAVKCLLRYLRGTIHHGVYFRRSSPLYIRIKCE